MDWQMLVPGNQDSKEMHKGARRGLTIGFTQRGITQSTVHPILHCCYCSYWLTLSCEGCVALLVFIGAR